MISTELLQLGFRFRFKFFDTFEGLRNELHHHLDQTDLS